MINLYHTGCVVYHTGCVVYHADSVVYHTKSVVYHTKFVVYHVLSVVYHAAVRVVPRGRPLYFRWVVVIVGVVVWQIAQKISL